MSKLNDGTEVVIRPIEPDDKDALLEGFEHLSDESRYRRFLSPTPRLTGAQLRYLTEVDHDAHEALIAFVKDTGEPIGVARYVRYPDDPAEAEPAVTVVDDWHGRGLGTLLLDELTERARAAGVARFSALVLAGNEPMLAMLGRLGDGSVRPVGDGVLTVEADLSDEGGAPTLHAALREAAAERISALKGAFLELGRRR